jgi:O-antigen biosynthesis protein
LLKNQKILIIGSIWPEPKSSAAGARMMQLIELLSTENVEMVFASSAQKSIYSENLDVLGVSSQEIYLNDSNFDAFVKDLNPTFVIYDRFMTEEQFGWRVMAQCSDAIQILDTEDLHCLRQTRQDCLKKGVPFQTNYLLENPISKREIASILRVDCTLVISEYEVQLLTDVFKINSEALFYLPFLVNDFNENILAEQPPFEQREGYVFIGNFFHQPNIDAVIHLKQNIWPIIKKLQPQAEVLIYGAYIPPKIQQLQNDKQGFIIKGRAENAKDVISKAKVMLAPLRFGAGLKGKLLEAMCYGTPTITTSIGAEGMNGSYPWNGFVTDLDADFATKAYHVYNNQTLWQDAQKNGVRIVANRFLQTKFNTLFINQILDLKANISVYRRNNFMGSLLRENQYLSSKYMSKWIELKNTKKDLT